MPPTETHEGYWILAERNLYCTWTYSVYHGETYLVWFFTEPEAQDYVKQRKAVSN